MSLIVIHFRTNADNGPQYTSGLWLVNETAGAALCGFAEVVQ